MRFRIIQKISLILVFNLMMILSLSAQNKIDANGKKQGEWVKYQDDNKVYEGQFIDDIPVGEFRYYYLNGHLKIRTVFTDNGRLNRTKMFFNSLIEKLQAEGNYLDKKKDSTWRYYNEDGFLILSENYQNGLKQGEFKVYTHEGLLNLEQTYENDTLIGVSTEYFEDSTILRQITYLKGIRQGEFKLYYPEGGLLLQGNYLNDIRDGIWTTYTLEGEIEFLDYYSKGELQRRTDKDGVELEIKSDEETVDLNIDPSIVDPSAIKR